MNNQTLVVIILAAIVIGAVVIYTSEPTAQAPVSYTNVLMKSPGGKDGVPGTGTGFEMDLWKWLGKVDPTKGPQTYTITNQ